MFCLFDILDMSKTARLRVKDLEDEAGFFFAPATEAQARKRIAEERAKSFVMRHPVITFGIPAMLKNNETKRKLTREIISGSVEKYDAHMDYKNAMREYRKALIEKQTKALKNDLKRRFSTEFIPDQK